MAVLIDHVVLGHGDIGRGSAPTAGVEEIKVRGLQMARGDGDTFRKIRLVPPFKDNQGPLLVLGGIEDLERHAAENLPS
ncbi:MAG TPA: hypothetical protein VMV05_12070 [bacterium]|nr:hypothetical protein [bacterium]